MASGPPACHEGRCAAIGDRDRRRHTWRRPPVTTIQRYSGDRRTADCGVRWTGDAIENSRRQVSHSFPADFASRRDELVNDAALMTATK